MKMESSKCVCVSGYLMSSLLYEHSNSDSDQEGFLVGDVIVRQVETISDNQLSFKKEETIVNIYSYVPCEDVYSFYTFNGSIQKDKLEFYLKNKQKDVVGWYHFRRHTPLAMSLREKAVHRNLNSTLFHGKKIVFGLFSGFSSENLATHTFDHTFFICNFPASGGGIGVFEPVTVNIVNLEDTAHDEYRLHPRAPVNVRSGIYRDIVTPSRSFQFFTLGCRGLSRVDEQLPESVLLSEDINTALLDKIEGLVEQVGGSEAEIGCITLDIKELEEKIAKSLAKGLSSLSENQLNVEEKVVTESNPPQQETKKENRASPKPDVSSGESSSLKCDVCDDENTDEGDGEYDSPVLGCARTRSLPSLKDQSHIKESKSDSC